RNRVAAARRLRQGQARDPGGGYQARVAAVGVPGVRGKAPGAVGEPLDIASLDGLGEAELLPEPGARRELPRIRIRRIDARAGRQPEPAPLDRAVRPQRVLRRIRQLVGPDLPGARRIEPGFAELLRQRRVRFGGARRGGPEDGAEHNEAQDEQAGVANGGHARSFGGRLRSRLEKRDTVCVYREPGAEVLELRAQLTRDL